MGILKRNFEARTWGGISIILGLGTAMLLHCRVRFAFIFPLFIGGFILLQNHTILLKKIRGKAKEDEPNKKKDWILTCPILEV
jgi:hypothetical protein